MAKVQLVSDPHRPTTASAVPATGSAAPLRPGVVGGLLDTSEVSPVVGASIDSVRQEVDDAYADMRSFLNREPDEIMRLVAGHSARLSELRVRIQRVEDVRREWRSVRTREVEPALDELRNQFAVASRLLSARELDWKIEAGER